MIPTELLIEIINKLDPNLPELIRLRRVSKFFRYVIDNFMIKELILFVNCPKRTEFWSYNNEILNSKNVIQIESARLLFDSNFNYVCRNVQRLYLSIKHEFVPKGAPVYARTGKPASIQIDLKNLKHCEIHRYQTDGKYHDMHSAISFLHTYISKLPYEIISNRLETFFINSLNDDVKIRSESLSWFGYEVTFNFKPFKLHESIKIMKCLLFNKWIKKMVNLEELYICYFWQKTGKFLRYFPRLKVLYIQRGYVSYLKAIECEKIDLNRFDLKIYCSGSEYLDYFIEFQSDQTKVNKIDDSFLNACSKDLSKVSPVFPFTVRLDYISKYEYIKQLDPNFDVRLSNVRSLVIARSSSTTQQNLINLVNSFQNLTHLTILFKNLDQKFFNYLPDVLAYLESIVIDNSNITPKLDIQFLFKFNLLNEVKFLKLSHFNLKDNQMIAQINRRKKVIELTHKHLPYIIDESSKHLRFYI